MDTGFIVMNHRNYPLFTKLLEQLQVPLDASSMTFSFYDQASRYGYSGNRLSSLFPSASYYFRPQHLRLIRDLWRFARIGYRDLTAAFWRIKPGAYCQQRNFSHEFLQHYLHPMGAAIWSSPVEQMRLPCQPYLHFLKTMDCCAKQSAPMASGAGGSRQYVEKLIRLSDSAQLSAAPNPHGVVTRALSYKANGKASASIMSSSELTRMKRFNCWPTQAPRNEPT